MPRGAGTLRRPGTLRRSLPAAWGTRGWDAPEQGLLGSGFSPSGSWARGIPGRAALASRLAEPWRGSLIAREAGDGVRSGAAFVQAPRAAVQSRSGSAAMLVLFLPAAGGSVILFCTSTNHQVGY